MPKKHRDEIRLLTQQGLTEAQAEREIKESNEDWDWIQTWFHKKIENTTRPGVIDNYVSSLRNSRSTTKTTLKVDINTELYNLINFLSSNWPTTHKSAVLTKQKIVELLLTHYLTDHTDEAIDVLARHLEQIDNWHKATRAQQSGYRTPEDDREKPLGPEYERPE
ncbi:hypothetical protein [Corynebacterium sp. KPL3804]|uniref:hypothetical protein n=1 Tax=Corynebacterium sp. KPL3804 TaxID=3135442 RepID=UPI0030C91130